MLDVVNSFHKAPVYAVAPEAGAAPGQDTEFDDAEDVELDADAGAAPAPRSAGASGAVRSRAHLGVTEQG